MATTTKTLSALRKERVDLRVIIADGPRTGHRTQAQVDYAKRKLAAVRKQIVAVKAAK